MKRSRRGRRCRNCPEETQVTPTPVADAASKAVGQLAKALLDPRLVSVDGEADRLWKHVLFGTGTCVGMIEGYVNLEMPGNPLPHLHNLAGRLIAIIEMLEAQKKATNEN